MEEIWKDVVGYENYFMVSNLGNVFSKRTGKILKQHINKQGRAGLATRIGGRHGKAVCFKIHRLVAEAFIANPENKKTVNHKDGNPLNNLVDNLEWATYSENMQHAFDTGLVVAIKGHINPNATLSKSSILYIRENPDGLTIRELASLFDVHHCTIVRCKNYKRYKPL